MSIYTDEGYENRRAYLDSLAQAADRLNALAKTA